ncbi:MAG TPA: lipoxygenase family protein, partial [Kofleriaceae bacterium]|nr:lipoxygenase family protein [Kofleriaceae bacterium]
MNPFARLVLPQNDSPENRTKRQQTLAQQQGRYRFDYHTATLAGLPMAATPIPIELSLVWAAGVAEVALTLGENLLNLVLPNFIDFDVQIPLEVGSSASGALDATRRPALPVDHLEPRPAGPAVRRAREIASGASGMTSLAADAARFKQELEEARTVLASFTLASGKPPPLLSAAEAPTLAETAAFVGKHVVASAEGAAEGAAENAIEQRVMSWLEDLIHKLEAFLGKLLGVYGRPGDIDDYQRQFRTLPLPWPAGVYQADEVFAQMRVAGPNPLVLRRATAEDLAGLALGAHAASIADALGRRALFVADYSALHLLQPGTNPGQKYVFTPRAFFEVPGAGKRSLRPVAIQTGSAAPVVFPGDGTAWEVAKVIVNMADGNYHELISHLGLTHLLTEPFVITTHRQLDPEHPLYVLLAPHFAGTLFINYAAQTTLITDGGAVDKLLTGTIESSRKVSATAVQAVRYNETFLPLTLAARGVADREALPDYPYRDDAMALWTAIHAWVTAYLQIYYPGPADVTGDYELQAWIAELASDQGGRIQDIGEPGLAGPPRIETAAYLAKLLTQVIFTASAQHAAVNFPQRTIMSFTPAMPLAAYAPFPAPEGAPATQILDILPPLQIGLLQQAIGTVLGGVQYTALGQYGGELATLQVQDALQAFQQELQQIEVDIHRKNALGERTS